MSVRSGKLVWLLPLAVAYWLVAAPAAYAKKMYRWVDENGNVYFSDQVPPDQVKHKRETLNQDARILDSVDKAKSAEELSQQQRLQSLRREQNKLIEKQAASDKVLLATYRTLDDINRAFENKMALMDGKQRVLEGNKQRLEQQLLQQQQQAAENERNGRTIPEKLIADIASTEQQIKQADLDLQRHAVDRQAAEKEFRADIARFEILTRSESGGVNDAANAAVHSNDELGLFSCENTEICENAWAIAGQFVREFATTGPDVDTELLIMSAPPINDNDIGLSVSRLGQEPDKPQIFLDVRCKNSTVGKELCASDRAQTIRKNFVGYIQLRLSTQQQGADTLIGK
ncbi:DUF4124 domain-containing protein [Methylomonas sp. HYX-M1]|uniref:DUF4124 domain-containing protein n=1 Tax=Methylomonas sp. HYX-M1 TaxID=3139307 RepID=UPI00345BADE3